MYCVKCGKPNNNGDLYCDECKAKMSDPFESDVEPAPVVEEAAAVENVTVEPTPVVVAAAEPKFSDEEIAEQKKRGRKKAIIGTVLAAVGYFIIDLITTINGIALEVASEYGMVSQTSLLMGIITIVVAAGCVALSVFGIVYGARSVSIFCEAKKKDEAKPVATFVLGIVALALATLAVIICMGGFVDALEMIKIGILG